jgi:hypothetical protein
MARTMNPEQDREAAARAKALKAKQVAGYVPAPPPPMRDPMKPNPGTEALRNLDTRAQGMQAIDRSEVSGRTPQAEWDNERVGQYMQQRRDEAQRNGLSPQQFAAAQALPPMPTKDAAAAAGLTGEGEAGRFAALEAAKALGVTPGNFPTAPNPTGAPLQGHSTGRTMAEQKAMLLKLDAFKESGAAGRQAVEMAIRNRRPGQDPNAVLDSARSAAATVRSAQEKEKTKASASLPPKGGPGPGPGPGLAAPDAKPYKDAKPEYFGQKFNERTDSTGFLMSSYQRKAQGDTDQDVWNTTSEHDKVTEALRLAMDDGYNIDDVVVPMPPPKHRKKLVPGRRYLGEDGRIFLWDGKALLPEADPEADNQ